jgi:glutathione S-transferase
MTITVHGHPLSPFVRKVLLALDVKGIEHENIVVFPNDSSPGFRAISPLGRIPVLQDGDFTVPDSSVICRYLERVFPQTPIYPAEPKLEARALWIEEYADTKVIENCAGLFQQRFLFPRLMNKPTDQAIVDNILTHGMPPVLDYLESIAPASGYFVGNALSIADISVVTCFLQAQYGDFTVDSAKYPKLGRFLAGAFASPIVTARMAKERAALGPLGN